MNDDNQEETWASTLIIGRKKDKEDTKIVLAGNE